MLRISYAEALPHSITKSNSSAHHDIPSHNICILYPAYDTVFIVTTCRSILCYSAAGDDDELWLSGMISGTVDGSQITDLTPQIPTSIRALFFPNILPHVKTG